MKILVETQTRPKGRLAVISFDVTGGGRRPIDLVFEGTRWEAVRERNKRCERWPEIDGVDSVEANAVPVGRL